MRTRASMLPVKNNFKKGCKNDLICRFCKKRNRDPGTHPPNVPSNKRKMRANRRIQGNIPRKCGDLRSMRPKVVAPRSTQVDAPQPPCHSAPHARCCCCCFALARISRVAHPHGGSTCGSTTLSSFLCVSFSFAEFICNFYYGAGCFFFSFSTLIYGRCAPRS